MTIQVTVDKVHFVYGQITMKWFNKGESGAYRFGKAKARAAPTVLHAFRPDQVKFANEFRQFGERFKDQHDMRVIGSSVGTLRPWSR